MRAQWPKREAYFWQEAPAFRLLLPLAAGILVYDRWPRALPVPMLWWMLGAITVAAVVISLLRSARTGADGLRAVLIHAAIALFGYAAGATDDVQNNRNFFGRGNFASEYAVRVRAPPAEKTRIWKVSVEALAALDSTGAKPVLGAAFLNVYKGGDSLDFRAGDTLIVPGGWQAISGASNPFAFDYAQWCRRQGILFQQFLGPDQIFLHRKSTGTEAGWIHRLHDRSLAALRRHVPDRRTLGMLEAMLLGYEGDFDPDLRQAYSETGVIHVVAISGSHLATLFLAVQGLLYWWKGRRAQVAKYALGVALVWVYVLVAGTPPSAVRSAVMFSVVALAFVLRREGTGLNTLCAAGIALLAAEPMWLFAVGFQLSFAAVLSLIVFYRPISRLWIPPNRALRAVWAVVAGSAAAQILTAPLSVYYFHNFPLLFLPANVVAWLMMGFLALLGGMLILLAAPVPPLAGAIAAGVTVLVQWFNGIIGIFQKANPASFSQLYLTGAGLAAMYAAILGLGLYWLEKRRGALLFGLAALCALVGLMCVEEHRALRQDRLVVYASGGQHAVAERIRGKRHVVVYADTSTVGLRALKDAHIGYRAWRAAPRDSAARQEAFVVGGKRVLFLNSEADYSGTFPVDVLVLHCSLKGAEPATVRRTFSPALVVIPGGHPRWQALKWREAAKAVGLRVHAVAEQGAWEVPQ